MKIKIISIAFILMVSTTLSYFVGFLNGTNESLSLRSITEAQAQLITISLIEKENYEKAISFNEQLLDGNIEQIKKFQSKQFVVFKSPERFISLKKSLNENKEQINVVKVKVLEQFKKRKENGLTQK